MTLAERIVKGLRASEAPNGSYHLERADLHTLAEASTWLRDWTAENGHMIWRSSDCGDTRRDALAKHFLWLRFCFDKEQIARGGQP